MSRKMFEIIKIDNQEFKVPKHLVEDIKAEIDSLVCICNLGLGMTYSTGYKYHKRSSNFVVWIFIYETANKDNWYKLHFEVNPRKELEQVIYFSHRWHGDVYEKVDFLKPIREMRKTVFSHEKDGD